MVALAATGAHALGADWIRLKSAEFELLTDAGAARGHELLARLEQVHWVFGGLTRGGARSPVPVRVFLFASDSEFRHYRPGEATTGYFQGGPERNYIVMRWAGPETWRVAAHEYIHLLLNHSAPRLPRWLEEGTAEFYSTLQPEGQQVRIGTAIPAHLARLATAQWLDASTLVGVRRDSPHYNERGRTGIFYAQSWALVHMMNLGEKYRRGMAEFARLLENGQPHGAAFEEAFGTTVAAALRDLRGYVSGGRLPQVTVDTAPVTEADIGAPEAVPRIESEMALADLLWHLGRQAQAQEKYTKLARQGGSAIEVETGLGAAALERRDYEGARRHLGRAIELGSRQAETHFEYAMLLRETGGSPDEVERHLRRTVELNPNFAEAHFLLGAAASQAKRYGDAIAHLERAVAVLPRQSYFWHALAMAYHGSGNLAGARRAAWRARDSAVTDHELGMAEAALKLVETQPAAIAPKRPEVTTPKSWEGRRGDSRIEGTLERIDCLGVSARFQVAAGGRRVALHVANPNEVALRNAGGVKFEFACGPQRPRAVVIEYIARPDSRLATAGDVVTIEFK